jgi:hypothetical protein
MERERTEFQVWNTKQLTDEIAANDRAQEQITEGFIKSEVARIEEQERLDELAAMQEAKRLQQEAAARAEIREQMAADEIRSWTARIEQQQALDEQAAKYEAQRLQDAARQREERWKRSFANMRGVAEDAFAGMSGAVSTSIRGIIQGTQTMEQAFKRMGESIALGLVDSIINRGLRQVSDSLLNFVFGGSGGAGVGGLLSSGGSYLMQGLSAAGSLLSSGGSAVVDAIGSFLGFFDTGLWKVPAGKTAAVKSGWGGARGDATTASGWAMLHPGEMVVPTELADRLRRIVALTGGSDFGGLAAVLGGGGSGIGGSSRGGQYGSLSPGQRSALGLGVPGLGLGSFGFGLMGFSAVTPGFGFMSRALSGVLGIDALMNVLGIASMGYVGPTEADYQSIRDIYGYASRIEADTRTAAAIGRSLAGELQGPTAAQTEAAAVAAGFAPGNVAGSALEGTPTEGAPSYGEGGYGESTSSTSDGLSGPGDVWASGGLFRTQGRTRMVVGEAGTETVAVLRNPREVALALRGGGGERPVVINLYNSGVIGDELPDNLMRAIQRELRRRDARQVNY